MIRVVPTTLAKPSAKAARASALSGSAPKMARESWIVSSRTEKSWITPTSVKLTGVVSKRKTSRPVPPVSWLKPVPPARVSWAAEPVQHVVAAQAAQDVRPGIAGDAVVRVAAGQVQRGGLPGGAGAQHLDLGTRFEDIGAGRLHRVAALAGALDHTVLGGVHRVEVVAAPAAHQVVAGAPVQHVVALAAIERVVRGGTQQGVVVDGAFHGLIEV